MVIMYEAPANQRVAFLKCCIVCCIVSLLFCTGEKKEAGKSWVLTSSGSHNSWAKKQRKKEQDGDSR